jgi:hypothetical protein
MDPFWNNAAKTIIANVIGQIPVVGTLYSALVYIFWPQTGYDVWSAIKDQVEQLIDQKMDAHVFQTVQDDLTGLSNVLNNYGTAIQSGDPNAISTNWIAVNNDFDLFRPHFQSTGYELLLLPLFAQFANLHLAILRDGALHGADWGWNEQYQQSVAVDLTDSISAYATYANDTYLNHYNDLADNTGANYHECEPFRTLNGFKRQMTLSVLDFAQLWQYFDSTQYPGPIDVYLGREIYSDPVGTCDNSGVIVLPSPPTEPISQFTVWGSNMIYGAQVTYPTGGGPGGITDTGRMGAQSDGYKYTFDVSTTNPATLVNGFAGNVPQAMGIAFKDGTYTGLMGGSWSGGDFFQFWYFGNVLSSIHINGISNYYACADSFVFGFKLEQSQTANVDALRTRYITSPLDVTVDDLAAHSVAKPAALDELSTKASQEDWDSQRRQYWEYVISRSGNESS